MSHTHLLYHLVFATKDRIPLISESWEGELYRYLGGIIRNHKGEAIEINGMPEHVHIFARLGPIEGLADLMRDLKASSSKWVRRIHEPKFSWQRRYGAFTVSESASDAVRNYIRDQKTHHADQLFETEYGELLRRHRVEFDERYLWD
ncbi:MAG TPA: IS200/IS605 family transposase [Pyrinomonadaceae bacterium]|jgi:REP element-mobilizing transposase RayT|nr:IS200/IS605 family transposase [Pyrinomonadaceae bacterium]